MVQPRVIMADFIFLMHDDVRSQPTSEMWTTYISGLRDKGVFDGGSSIGDGTAFRKQGECSRTSSHLAGYIRVRAMDAQEAQSLLGGNPVFEAGGTVEILELPADR
jgi:hypothetical protein